MSTINVIIGNDIAAIIDDNDTILVEITIIINMPRAITAINGDIPNIIPNIEATPLPPLNPLYNGKICPITEQIPNII